MSNSEAPYQGRRVNVFEGLNIEGRWQTVWKGEAKFCFFSTDYEELESGHGLFPAAVVEWPSGRLESLHVNFVAFVITETNNTEIKP
jgi:hypothetical protein